VTKNFSVYLVDDDLGVLNGLSRLLRAKNYDVKAYSSPQLFLKEHDVTLPGCAVLDVSMPGLDGLKLQRELAPSAGLHRPVVFITGKGDIPTSVHAMKAGAIDFLTKPVMDAALFDAISRAETRDGELRKAYSGMESIRAKIKTLTPREREVLGHVVAGRQNKQIAADLGTVEKTIKVHRSRMMQKLGIRNLADLVRMTMKLD
jgi:FixJ family two-component response regulator